VSIYDAYDCCILNIIGAGPSGAIIASRLARTPKAPRMLRLEAGDVNAELINRIARERFTFFASAAAAELNYAY